MDVVYRAPPAALVEAAVANGEGLLTVAGALAADTGKFTGRSPSDKFIVRNGASTDVDWGDVNQVMDQDSFDRLLQDMVAHARTQKLYVQDLYAGADPRYRLGVRVITQYAWHALFARNLFIEQSAAPAGVPGGLDEAGWTVVDLPSFE